MAGVFNSDNVSRKLSDDSASSLFDDSVPHVVSTTSSSIPQRQIGLRNDQFNGFQPARNLADQQTSGTLLDGILQNLSIIDNGGIQTRYCTCIDGNQATSYCSVCKDYMCENCVVAHSRVKMTRGHLVKKLDSLPICDKCVQLNHTGHRIQRLQKVIDASRSVLGSLISQSRAKIDSFTKLSTTIMTRLKTLDLQATDACSNIQSLFLELFTMLENRQQELLTSVHQNKQVKFQVLNGKFEEICEMSNHLKKLTDTIQRECEFSNGINVITAKETLTSELANAERSLSKNAYFDDESIIFVPPDSAAVTALSALGKIVGRQASMNMAITRPQHSVGAGFSPLVINLPRPGEVGEVTHENVKEKSMFLPHQLLEKQEKALSVKKPIALKDCKQSITNDLRDILRGPPPLQIIRITKPRLSFGGMGEKDGQLCRPWGVACDRNGNFIVADRSNNRIQIFSSDGVFVRKFGSSGSKPGQFNRPAGLSVDVHDRIVVADKDNHRIQIFSLDGDFLFSFGERGSKHAQFYYPWDIATDSKGLIAVTDTRNHRIQIFDPNGKFIGKYGFEGILWKHFDSPRGVHFTNNDMNLVVTDFNNHRLVIIPSDLQSARFLGSEGCQPSQFMRPQGVAVDKNGNYIVADSRNNRLQVFSPTGNVIIILGGSQGNNSEEMDRPSGIAVSPDGGIAVVDFGNNRVLVY